MKLLIESAMIFFGTLMAAGIVALGEPARADAAAGREFTPGHVIGRLIEAARPWSEPVAPAHAGADAWHE
ncbi:MAG: hypothetical protein H0X13_00605 [Ramlibacter sp.]|nr:hypothetical protein [Ramlibacter sp.]